MRYLRNPSTGASKRSRTSRLIALTAALALVLAACGGDDDDASDDTGSDDAPEETDEAEEPEEDEGEPAAGATDEDVELNVWFARDYYVPPDEFASLEAEYPNITVNLDVVPADDVFEQLVRMNEAGQKMPDVVHMDGFFQSLMYEAGIAMDITEYIEMWEEEEPELYDTVYDSVWEQSTWDDKIVGFANSAQLGQYFYRTDMFDEVGAEWPDNFEDLYETMAEIQGNLDSGSYAYAMSGVRGTANRIVDVAHGMGVQPAGEPIPDLDSEAGHYFIDWHQRLMREGIMHPDTITWGSSEYRASFIAGTTAVTLDSVGKAVDVVEAGPADDFALALVPTKRTPDGAEDGVRNAWFRTFQVTTTTDHPYEASLVLRYLADEENAVDVVLNGGDLSRVSTVLEDDAVRAEMPFFDDDAVEAFESAVPPPSSLRWFEIEDVWELLVQDFLQNPDTPAEELAAKWQAEFDALVE